MNTPPRYGRKVVKEYRREVAKILLRRNRPTQPTSRRRRASRKPTVTPGPSTRVRLLILLGICLAVPAAARIYPDPRGQLRGQPTPATTPEPSKEERAWSDSAEAFFGNRDSTSSPHDMDQATVAPAPGPDFETPAGDRRDIYTLTAYDCSVPHGMEAVQGPEITQCHSGRVAIRQRKASYHLLQASGHTRIKAKFCHRVETTLPFYCGVWSHTVMMAPLIKIMDVDPMTRPECLTAWDGSYDVPNKPAMDVVTGATNTLFYESVGRTSMSDGSVSCHGGVWMVDGEDYHSMVVNHYVKLDLYEKQLAIDVDGNVVDETGQFSLVCKASAGHCDTSQGTYVWDPPTEEESCPLYKTRETTGVVITDSEGDETYLSRDGAMLRLILREPVSMCNHLVMRTNYPDLYLVEDNDVAAFKRPLAKQEMAIAVFSNMGDDWVANTVTSAVLQEVRDVAQHQCERALALRKNNFGLLSAEQRPRSDGETTALGDGYFVTSAGQAWYRFQCRALTVRAREADNCYSALPITLSYSDAGRYYDYMGLDPTVGATDSGFYLEPHTNLLTTTAIPVACSSHFASLYRAKDGHWIRADPLLSMAATPSMMAIPKRVHALPPPFPDFSGSGIYTRAALRELERFRQMPQFRTSLIQHVALQALGQGWNGAPRSGRPILRPRDIFPELPIWSMFTLVGDFLDKWGRLASILVAIFGVWRFINWVAGMAMRLYAQYTDPANAGPVGPERLLELMMPSWTAVRMARLAKAGLAAKAGVHQAVTSVVNSPAAFRRHWGRGATAPATVPEEDGTYANADPGRAGDMAAHQLALVESLRTIGAPTAGARSRGPK